MSLQKAPTGAKKTIPPSERITSAVKLLAVLSVDAKSAEDDLCANIIPLEDSLAKLNLGISAWHVIAGNEHEDGSYWSREIGYTKIGRSWYIALKKCEGHHSSDYDKEEVWPFKDAPRWMQIESVTKIPDLLETLVKRTDDTIKNLRAKSQQAKELAEAFDTALAGIRLAEEADAR